MTLTITLILTSPKSINDSIGGFLIDKIGRIPKLGDSIEEEGIKITVVQINRYKLEMLKVEFS